MPINLILVKKLIPNIFLLFVAGVVLTPFLWLILAPSKTGDELKLLPPMSFGSFENYRNTISGLVSFQDGVIYDWLNNSLVYTLTAMAIGIATALLAGYALAVIPFRGKKSNFNYCSYLHDNSFDRISIAALYNARFNWTDRFTTWDNFMFSPIPIRSIFSLYLFHHSSPS